MDRDYEARKQLIQLIKGGNAHVEFTKALEDLPPELRGQRPQGSPHSLWELLEHMRIAQWDILEFSRDAKHKSPAWPKGYWPSSPVPPDEAAWDSTVKSLRSDMEAMCALVEDPSSDLNKPIPHGDGQTLMAEALLVADHNAYHLGQFVLVRKLLQAWNAA